MVEGINPAFSTAPRSETARPAPQNIREAAGQFEALLMGQLLKSAHASGSGWLDDGEDQAGSTATEMAEEQLAQALSHQGGLGLSQFIAAGLQPKDGSTRGTI